MKNYYDILEVSENASKEVIEKAYKVLVKKYHPDVNGATDASYQKMRDINEAYDVLSNDFLREQYNSSFKEEQYKKSVETNYSNKPKQDVYYKPNEKPKKENSMPKSSGMGIVELVKMLISERPDFSKIKRIGSQQIIALILTVFIVAFLGWILYVIPFTHEWMNDNFVDTPLTNLIKKIF
jgi:curved DNA-binding protein CbpA